MRRRYQTIYYSTLFQDGQDNDAVVGTVDERDIPDDTFSMGDTLDAASEFFPQLNVPGLNNLGASIQDQLENFNLFNKATPEEVEDDQVVIMGETEDGQTILIPTPGNANAPTIVSWLFS